MKAEEEEVDIDTIVDDGPQRQVQIYGAQGEDDDIAWANEEPDDDVGSWKMKIIMEDDSPEI